MHLKTENEHRFAENKFSEWTLNLIVIFVPIDHNF